MTTREGTRRGIAAGILVILLSARCGASAETPVLPTPVPPSPAESMATANATASPTALQDPQASVYPLAASSAWIVDQTGDPAGGAVIRLTRTDGTDRHPVATDARDPFHLHPEWSADGTGFTFVTTDGADGSRSIWRYDLGTDTSRLIVDCVDPCVDATEQAESPDGERVAYFYADGPIVDVTIDGQTLPIPTTCGLRIVTVATGDQETVTEGQCALIEERYPRWSSSGTHLAYLRTHADRQGGPITRSDIVVRDLAYGSEVVAAIGPGDAFDMLDWTADGSSIVFTSNGGLAIVGSNGGRIRELVAADPFGATHPRSTADGAWVLFYRTQTATNGEVIARSLWGVPTVDGDPVPILPVAPPGPNDGHTTWGSLQPTLSR